MHRCLTLCLYRMAGAIPSFVGCALARPATSRASDHSHPPQVVRSRGHLGSSCCSANVPIDIAFDRRSGLGPRIMPVTYGLLSAEGQELAKKGLIWPGGCIVFPNSPRWVLVP
jgi:hypothetical protein